MTALGPGVRVWVGWCPDSHVHGGDGRLKPGTIVDGPYSPGTRVGAWTIQLKNHWAVAIDGAGKFLVAEPLLSPLDDGDPEAVEQVDELEVLA